MKQDARSVALNTLAACSRQGAWSDGALKKAIRDAGLDSRDAALATQLCAGVLQNRMLCDFYLGCFSKMPLKRMEQRVLEALRLGAYQLLFLDRIPDSAAVNTSVELARQVSRNPRAAGMVNGILRSLAARKNDLPPIPTGDRAESLSIRYSHPKWLVEAFMDSLGEQETERLLQCDNERPVITAQVNPLCTSADALAEELEDCGISAQPHPWLPNCLCLGATGDLEELSAWRAGKFYIQDPAARLAAEAAAPEPGMHVLDVCAAPGGKTFAAALRMEDRGEVLSCDLHPHKIKLIRSGAKRLGLTSIEAQCQNASVFRPEWADAYDVVIADVPCSGLGVIRKKPDIRYKDPQPLEQLPAIQSAILSNVARYVRPGGVLLYSTCTVLRRENEAVVEQFLQTRADYTPEGFCLPGPVGEVPSGMTTLWPQRHGTDGFFLAKLRRAAT